MLDGNPHHAAVFDVAESQTATPATRIIHVGDSAGIKVKRGTPRGPIGDAEEHRVGEEADASDAPSV